MKQIRNICTIGLFAVLFSVHATAATNTDGIKNLPVALKYAGSIRNQPLIQLDFSGTKEENEFSISITDETGLVLYSTVVKGEVFSRQFLLNTDDLGEAILNFEITGTKSGRSISYTINPRSKTGLQMNSEKN